MNAKHNGLLTWPSTFGGLPNVMDRASPRTSYAIRISVGYAIVGTLWMGLTDGLPLAFGALPASALANMVEDGFFLIVTASLLYLALQKCPERPGSLSTSARVPHEAIWSNWNAYGFAFLTSLAMSAVAKLRADAFSNPHICGLMILPVILSAFLGGAGPGLTATAIGGATIALLAPPHDKPGEFLDLIFVLVLFSSNGMLVSLLSDLQHRSRRAAESARAMAESQFE